MREGGRERGERGGEGEGRGRESRKEDHTHLLQQFLRGSTEGV